MTQRKLLITGASGVLGTALLPALSEYTLITPDARELDLFDPAAVTEAVSGCDGVIHLATRIPPPAQRGEAGAWTLNDRLRTEGSRNLADAVLASTAEVFVVPTIAFFYPPGPADETTALAPVPPHLRSALDAESEAIRVTAAGRRGVVLRFGLLWGPGTGADEPNFAAYDATLNIASAAKALATALDIPGGIYNVVDDGQRISDAKFRAATA